MQTSLVCARIVGYAVLAILLLPCKAHAQDRSRDLSQQKTGNTLPEGPAIHMLITEQLPRHDLRRLVTNSRIIRGHPDLADYYQSETQRLLAESQQYERFARAAGDHAPLNEPNHYGVSRSARFDYLAARDKLRRAQEDNLLAALNRQAIRKEGCFSCHNFHHQGGNIAPDLGMEGIHNRSEAWLIGHFKDPQAYTRSSIMPAVGGLTSEQLEVLSAFLQYQK